MSLRIGIVAHAGVGGSGTVAAELAHGLGERGHDVHLITPGRSPRLPPRSTITVHDVQPPAHSMWSTPPWSLPLVSRIAAVAEEATLDLVHAHYAVPYAIAADFSRQLLSRPLPLVVTLHGSDVTKLAADPAYAPLIALAVRRAEARTVPSEALRQACADALGPHRITVVPNFVDGARFRPDPDRRAPAGRLVLVHASNMRPVKRPEDVVAVLARVAERTDAELWLVGDGPHRPAILADIEARGLADRVRAPGALAEVERWLGGAHVALVPSAQESFGLAALEALCCGTPVVGSRVGGLPEVVRHGETGFLEEVEDVDAMADRVLSFADEPERWRRMSADARRCATTRFSPDAAFAAYEAVYHEALRHPGSDAAVIP